jgi:nicotinate dehydrogenase subunit A
VDVTLIDHQNEPAFGAIALEVNGVPRTTHADPRMPLLYYLRNDLGLKGTRFGCGSEGCGACTVLVGGRKAFACTLPLEQAAGASVQTIECEDNIHVRTLKRAFVERLAGQCGYCLSGIIMSAAALLVREAFPTRANIAQALGDNLCRCGAHPRILDAIEQAREELGRGTVA